MTTLKYLAWLLTCTSLLSLCNCQDSVVSVIQRLDQLEEELLDNKGNILRVEQKVLNIIDVAKTSLRAELKENIRDQVKDAMAEILQGESLQDMVKSEVVSELRHLKQGYHQMKRQMHHVSRELKDFKNETTVFHDSVLEKTNVWNRENSSDVCVREKHKLEIELQKCNIYSADLKTNMERFIVLNETYQTQISQLRTALSVPACTSASANVTSTSKPPVSTTSVTTPRPPVSTASVSTSRQEEEKTRILIAPIWTNVYHKFRQLNIHSNSLTVYQHITRNYVNCLAYISKQRKLLIGSNSPYSILASTLDTGWLTVLRNGVRTLCMAVDEDRDIVFISRLTPRHSISRMSTRGKDLTVIIDLSMYERSPRQIALDTKRKRIYVCIYEAMFTVTYDGQGLSTLATGGFVHAVTLDQTAGVLYYNNWNKLMKMTVSNNVSTEVTTLDADPCNMRLYRGTIYYAGCSPTIVGAVNVTHNAEAYTLQEINMKGVGQLYLCLIPESIEVDPIRNFRERIRF